MKPGWVILALLLGSARAFAQSGAPVVTLGRLPVPQAQRRREVKMANAGFMESAAG